MSAPPSTKRDFVDQPIYAEKLAPVKFASLLLAFAKQLHLIRRSRASAHHTIASLGQPALAWSRLCALKHYAGVGSRAFCAHYTQACRQRARIALEPADHARYIRKLI
jgi:hypothetical protein